MRHILYNHTTAVTFVCVKSVTYVNVICTEKFKNMKKLLLFFSFWVECIIVIINMNTGREKEKEKKETRIEK